MKARGRIRESAVFAENITLTREIETRLGENRLIIRDCIENCGFDSQPLMLLYHCNFGYPLLDKETRLILPDNTATRARDTDAAKGLGSWDRFDEPQHGYREQVFYHDFTPQADGMVTVKLYNRNLGESGLGIYMKFNKNQLPYFIEWKQVGEGDYVVGLEPATWYPEGRGEARKRGELKLLEPGASKEVEIEIGILEQNQV